MNGLFSTFYVYASRSYIVSYFILIYYIYPYFYP